MNQRNKNPYYCGKDGKDLFDRFKEGFLSKDEFKGFIKGNIIKYVTRAEQKNGIEDLEKARDYINRYIELLESEKNG